MAGRLEEYILAAENSAGKKQQSIFRKKRKNIPVVTAAAMISDTGSATNTAKALLSGTKNTGRTKIRGISRMIFRRQAISKLIFACPSAIKACWQLIWKPTEKPHAKNTRMAQAV